MSFLPTFTHRPDGRALVDSLPRTMAITRELLEYAAPGLIERRWRTVTFHNANLTASYRMMRRGPCPRSYMLVKVVGA